ncbi:hypothetical protein [Mycobacterium sp. Marseille-P9652]|uniref:hypothetical protein n=1 Tax=Mycobacterium sp. Marseille-P9652 TaxID=2654950 RepID=UPI0012E856DD|nr:hypothetical protein [Mycobacterium sp. Marseille-P9652]
MKLARPDVFHPRIVLAGCRALPEGDGDDDGLVAALRRRGLHARWLAWDDPETSSADLVILRAARDYPERLDEFLAWAVRVPHLLNAPAVVAWNAHRRYLGDLADRGVPTVPGEVVAPGEPLRLPRTGQVFVGPAVGAGGVRCDPGSASVRARDLHAAGRAPPLQPRPSGVETVLVFIGGEPSHAFAGSAVAEPDFETWDLGAAALAGAAAAAGVDVGELLYARAHLSGDRLLELQLVDPSLGWRRLDAQTRDRAQRSFALAVESACERLGLGPFSRS